MTLAHAEAIARALLYEGYCLYPYRQSALKNRFRWTLGTLYPPLFAARAGERSGLHGECILRGADACLQLHLRFLQPALERDAPEPAWQQGLERRFSLPEQTAAQLAKSPRRHALEFEDAEQPEADNDLRPRALSAQLQVHAEAVGGDAHRIVVRVENRTPLAASDMARPDASLHAMASVHLLLTCRQGEFASASDPPAELIGVVHDCRNDGVWPVLIGAPPQCDTMLLTPIILSDYPAIASESPGDFFDATEIDELLALRVQTLTDAEKHELQRTDPRARALLERAEALSASGLQLLHGARRAPSTDRPGAWACGDRVRLRPRPGRDAFDLLLRGEAATVVGVERDLEGRLFCSVTVDRDPGRDLGAQGCVGHRFYFEPDELERLP